MNKNITVKQFLENLNTSLADADTKKMLEFSYYENDEKHYELTYGEGAGTITENTIIVDVEESKVFRV